MKKVILISFSLLVIFMSAYTQPWIPDTGNGRYKNPVIYADYSDPDVIRAGDDFYMVASSFNCMPGIPVLHSKDLVNWTIIGHVYDKLPFEKYDEPAHGQGSWAPSIRFHDSLFYVYFCTPQEGLFMATASNPAAKWNLHHVVDVELWEDPCPFWDDDGNAWLVRSKLRADVLYLHKMSADGKKILDNGKIIYNNVDAQPVIEGPKLIRKDDYYYIFAPAGGVPTGWQTVLRSKNIEGPYEDKIVMHQGNTDINGPHQGGIVQLNNGNWWFMHFQERGAWGRVDLLEPVEWINGWPLIGKDINNDGIGEPVSSYTKPEVEKQYPIMVPQTSDEFDSDKLGLQWQWHANLQKQWYSLTENSGSLRLYTVQNLTQNGNLWFVPNLLLQKFSAPSFTVTTKITFHPEQLNEMSGLVVMGKKWAFLGMKQTRGGMQLGMYTGTYYEGSDQTELQDSVILDMATCYLRVQVDDQALCRFFYSTDNKDFHLLGPGFTATQGVWIGAKVGLFSLDPNINAKKGFADVDWFRFENNLNYFNENININFNE